MTISDIEFILFNQTPNPHRIAVFNSNTLFILTFPIDFLVCLPVDFNMLKGGQL